MEASTEGSAQLPVRKRKKDEDEGSEAMNDSSNCIPTTTSAPPTKIAKTETAAHMGKKQQESVILKTYSASTASSAANKKARETRLEQNRKAARESRRRKKVMIEDLQRSVIFFSRANGALKHQNDELTRLLMQAQAQVSVIESTMNNAPVSASTTPATAVVNGQHQQTLTTFDNESPAAQSSSNEAKTPAPATSATPLPPPATTQTYPHVPVMQPGATMQAMASFQQAAAAAMQVAVQGMQGIAPGASLASLAQPAPTTGSASAQQAYNDTMTALAMQQAAIAAASVPPHLMAQIVGSYPAASTAPTLVAAPATILPATTAPIAAPASGSTTSSRAEVAAAPVPVAPMPSPVAIATQGAGES